MEQHGVMHCTHCQKNWVDELPPLWLEQKIECPECGGAGELYAPLYRWPIQTSSSLAAVKVAGVLMFGLF